MALSLTLARAAIDGGLARAALRGVPSCVAVVDAGGNLLAFAAHEDAMLACRELATAKAWTSLSLRTSTAALVGTDQPGGPFYGMNTALSRPLVTFAGGQVLSSAPGDPVVGAVGVSGGTLEDDEDIATAMVEAYRGARGRGA